MVQSSRSLPQSKPWRKTGGTRLIDMPAAALHCSSMKTAIQRWGNSLAVRIPRAFAAETRIQDGSEVELSLKDGALMVRPVRQGRLALSDLLKKIRPSNRHDEVSTGDSVGREIW